MNDFSYRLKQTPQVVGANNNGSDKYIMIDYYTISGLATVIIHSTKFVILLECDCAGAPSTLETTGIRSSYLLPLSSDCTISQIVWRKVSDQNYRIKIGTNIAISAFQVRLISSLNSSITKTYTQPT